MTNEQLYKQACESIPGGVNSPVRSFQAVGGTPVFIKRADKQYLWSEEGKKYLDFCLSWGPLILGHNHPVIFGALKKAIKKGTSYGTVTKGEIVLSELLKKNIPCIEEVRLVNSGTEAVMSALRLSRGFRGKDKIIKFEGCYHGHTDTMLVKAGSGLGVLSTSSSKGVGLHQIEDTIVLPYNDIDTFKRVFEQNKTELACIIVEPIAGNMGVVPPVPGFLETIRELCDKEKVILIFDEVISGYRVGPGGAQQRLGITPDLCTLGKIIGGGLPFAAFGGKREIMDFLSPQGPVYQAGTLSGNPLAVSAGIAVLRYLNRHPEIYSRLEDMGRFLEEQLKSVNGITVQRVGSMFTIFFSGPVHNYTEAKRQDISAFKKFFHHALEKGVYLPPSYMESAFLCTRHTERDIRKLASLVGN